MQGLTHIAQLSSEFREIHIITVQLQLLVVPKDTLSQI